MGTLGKLRKGALAASAIGAALCVVGWLTGATRFLEGYLIGYGFWLSASLGCLGLAQINTLTGGRWGKELRPMLVSGMSTFPIMAILIVPVLLGIGDIYVWSQPDVIAASPLLQTKLAWLNKPFFLIRMAIYFVTWIVLSWFASRRPGGLIAGFGTLFLVLTLSFFAFDFYMSLEPLWYSSLYGGMYLVGSLIITFSLLAIFSATLREGVSADHLHDIGKFMLMSVMLWGYLTFSQYLILYSAQIPEEMEWYRHRAYGGWQCVAWVLVIFHFAVPFLFLLQRGLKRNPKTIVKIAAYLLVMRFVDLSFWVVPSLSPEHLRFPLWAPGALLLVGGLWLFQFTRKLEVARGQVTR